MSSNTIAAPFTEPASYTRALSPYYKESHRYLREYVARYVEDELTPYAPGWESKGQVPPDIVKRHAELGFSIIDPSSEDYMGGIKLPAGLTPQEWDDFHSLIVTDQMGRLGYTGVLWGLGGGNAIGLPPILNFGTEQQKKEFLPKATRGEIRFCLGITEPDAGSDVARIQTTAKRMGNIYIVNGCKKWITNGIWADFCTTAVRTGGSGSRGISLLIVPLKVNGVTCARMENSGVAASGSTFIEFDDVEVPLANMIGKENEGFKIIMSNFNPERLRLAASSLRLARVCLADAFAHAITRETFGKKLIENQIIRVKFAACGRLIEPAHAFLEQLVYMVSESKAKGLDIQIGGMTALLKIMSTQALEQALRESQQIMGGLGYSKNGKGARIEQISRDLRVMVIGGGSEEIMSDLAIRQEMQYMRTQAKAKL